MEKEIRDALQNALGSGYRIERELGGGGMSRVFIARDIALDRDVVVKVLPPESTGGVSAERFRREIQVIAKLQHPHVVSILAAGSADGALYYVMPFIGGETLRARVAREGPLPIADAVRILREILDALAFAHSHGVIHRDIKPENVLIEAGHAVVADFGVAKALRESGPMTSVGLALGTPAYMAPEQATADPTADHRADLYAVGVLGYELLTGAPPFSGSAQQLVKAHITDAPTPIRQRRSDVPDALADVLMRALAKEPADRPQSAKEMLASLDSAITPTATTPLTGSAATAPSSRSKAMVAAAVVVVLAVGAFLAWRGSRSAVLAGAESMAVAPFVAADGDSTLTRIGKDLVTTITSNLDGVGEIRTADAVAMLHQAASAGHALSAVEASAAAKSLGARSVVHGTLTRVGAVIRADLSLYRVDSAATPIVRLSVTAPPDSISALSDSLTWSLLRSVWQKGRAPTPSFETVSTHSFAALRAFLEGEQAFSRSDMNAASEAYVRAIAADSNFWFAIYRLRVSRGWYAQKQDTALNRRLMNHLGELPARDRELILADTGRISVRTVNLRKFVEKYPNYAPAWQMLADHLIHSMPREGFEIRDAIAPLQRAKALMPNDLAVLDHLVIACSLAGDEECARREYAHFDSLVRGDPKVANFELGVDRLFHIAFTPMTPRSIDSLVSAIFRDSAGIVSGAMEIETLQGAAELRPAVTSDVRAVMSGVLKRVGPPPELGFSVPLMLAEESMTRGAWLDGIAAADKDPASALPSNALRQLRWRVIGEAVGAISPSPATGDSARALSLRVKPGDRVTPVSLKWIEGVNALMTKDEKRFGTVIGELAKDTSSRAKHRLRSLRGLALGLGGNRSAAGDSLYALDGPGGFTSTTDAAGFALDRLFAARWLEDAGKPLVADSLLRWTNSYYIPAAQGNPYFSIFALAQLERSRIAETLGNKVDAVRYAKRFVSTYDLAPAAHKPLVAEARERIARLGGSPDARKP